ncbi:MAG: hypothetical protein ACMUHB_02250 [Thermoplasmatota archaeon]
MGDKGREEFLFENGNSWVRILLVILYDMLHLTVAFSLLIMVVLFSLDKGFGKMGSVMTFLMIFVFGMYFLYFLTFINHISLNSYLRIYRDEIEIYQTSLGFLRFRKKRFSREEIESIEEGPKSDIYIYINLKNRKYFNFRTLTKNFLFNSDEPFRSLDRWFRNEPEK